MPLRTGKTQPGGAWPLHPRLDMLHVYTRLKMSSSKVSVVVRNMSKSSICLKKGAQVARMVSALTIPPVELSLELEAILGMEDKWEPLSVAE